MLALTKQKLKELCPIHPGEWAKFIYMFLIMASVVYVHTTVKTLKDVLILSHLSTEVISAIKMWLVLPISLAVMLVYMKLSDMFKRSTLFHLLMWGFIGFFVLFAVLIYPNYRALTIHFDASLVYSYPFLKYILIMISNWHFALFYLFAELWVTIILSISVWQAINHITAIEESKRFYPLMGLSANIGMMIAGFCSKYFATHNSSWQGTLNTSIASITIAAALVSWSLVKLVNNIGDQTFNSTVNVVNNSAPKKTKTKISFADSVRMIFSSRAVMLIVLLLLSYNVSLNLIEGIWKKSIEISCAGNANLIQGFLSQVNAYISEFSIVLSIVGIYILKAVSWRTAAMITPALFTISGGIFFLYLIFRDASMLQAFIIGGSAIYTASIVGAFHNISARSSKHTIYDSTKEMVYIPLSNDIKTKGKAAAELIGSRFGKGSGAFIQQCLLTIFPTMSLLDLTPILSVIFLLLMVAWFYSTIELSKLLKNLGINEVVAK